MNEQAPGGAAGAIRKGQQRTPRAPPPLLGVRLGMWSPSRGESPQVPNVQIALRRTDALATFPPRPAGSSGPSQDTRQEAITAPWPQVHTHMQAAPSAVGLAPAVARGCGPLSCSRLPRGFRGLGLAPWPGGSVGSEEVPQERVPLWLAVHHPRLYSAAPNQASAFFLMSSHLRGKHPRVGAFLLHPWRAPRAPDLKLSGHVG